MNKDINAEYSQLEDEYYAGNKDRLMNMWRFATRCLRTMIQQYNQRKLQGDLTKEDIDERVEIGSYWFLERYLKNPEFRCGKLTSYLPFSFKKAMWGNEIRKQELNRKYEHLLVKEYAKQFLINNGVYEDVTDIAEDIVCPCGVMSSSYRCNGDCLFALSCPLFFEQKSNQKAERTEGRGKTE